MDFPILKYDVTDIEYVPLLCEWLTNAGYPTTVMTRFNWHHYTRVLQFQVRMAAQFSDWGLYDIDGIVGPKTWGALGILGKPRPSPEPVRPPAPVPAPTQPTPSAMPLLDIRRESPNQSQRGATISHIVLHNTAGSFDGSVDWLCNRAAEASAHLVISRKAITAQLVPFSRKAWHAGNARMNANSIGIEIEATVNQRGMTPVQEARVIEWVKWLMQEYDIPAANVGIHRWYRNTDCPGLIWPTDDEFKLWRTSHFGG